MLGLGLKGFLFFNFIRVRTGVVRMRITWFDRAGKILLDLFLSNKLTF